MTTIINGILYDNVKIKKNSSYKPFWSILLIGVMILLTSISLISAFDFDNTKDYNETIKTITINNCDLWIGICLIEGDTISNIKLNTPINNEVGLGYVKVWEKEVEMFNDEYKDFFQEEEYYNIRDKMNPIEVKVDWKYKTTKIIKGIDKVCTTEWMGTKVTCVDEPYEREVVEWKDFTGKDMLKGNITLSGWTNVNQGDYIEWIYDYGGIRGDEFATWEGNISTNIISYYKLDGDFNDSLGLHNGTNSGVENVTGKIIYGGDWESGNQDTVLIGHLNITTHNFTVSAWIKPESFIAGGTTMVGGHRDGALSAFGFYLNDSGGMSITSVGVNAVNCGDHPTIGVWNMVTLVYDQDANLVTCYLDGDAQTVGAVAYSTEFSPARDYNFGYSLNGVSGAAFQDGVMDEIGIWNRSLSAIEVTLLYNSDDGCQYDNETCFGIPDGSPTSTLNAPTEAQVFTSSITQFNCTGVDDLFLQNISLIINGTYNVTNATVSNNTIVTNTVVLAEGGYNWTCEACDNKSQCTNATTGNFSIGATPTIYIVSPPVNTSNYTTSTIYFNASSDLGIDKWIINYNGTNHTLTDINTSVEVEDGNHHIFLYGNNSDSGEWGLNDTYYFNVDTTPPVITNFYPNISVDYHKANTNITLNFTMVNTNRDSCWYGLGGTNYTLNCSINSSLNITNYNINNLTYWANDTFGNTNSLANSWSYKLYETDYESVSPVTEGSSNVFYGTFTTNGSVVTLANLNYNGTNYTGSISHSGDISNISKTFTALQVLTDTNLTFYWTITTNEGFTYFTDDTNQTVIEFGIDNCTTYSYPIYNFTQYNEETQVELNESAIAINTTINLQLYVYGTTIQVVNYSTSFKGVNPYTICLENNLSGGGQYNINLELQYDAEGYAQEFYNIQNETISSADINTNIISLYNLNDSQTQEFRLIAKDSNFLALDDALIVIQRKYVEEGIFKTVEIPKTDGRGETVAKLQLEDVIYNFIVIKNGVTIVTINNVKAVCQTPAISTCEIDLNAFASSITVPDYEENEDFNFTLGYNETSRIISSIFTIPSGTPSYVSLNVTREDSLGTVVCTDYVTSSSGTLSCVVPSSFGNSTVLAQLYRDSDLQSQGNLKLDQDASDIYGVVLIFLSLFVMLSLLGVGISDNPVFTLFFLVLGIILLFAFNLVNNNGFIGATATILWIIVAIILVAIKASRRS